jgi:hypothetical protein
MCNRVPQKTKIFGCAGFSHSYMSIESEYHDKKFLNSLFQLHVKIEKCDFESASTVCNRVP